MSWRSLVEVNHDTCPTGGELLAWAARFVSYLKSGEPKLLPNGVTFLQRRHHSDPEPKGWMPPQNREPGLRCLGWIPWMKHWAIVRWEEDRHAKRPRPHWSIDGQPISVSRAHQPTAFLPMPPPPGEPDAAPAPIGGPPGLLPAAEVDASRICELEEKVEALRSLAHPGGHMKGTRPLVLYFGNDADRAEMIRAIREAKPDMRAVKL